MRELHDYTLTEAVNFIVEDIVEAKGISKALAKKLVINALLYNVVTDEIIGQVYWLMEDDNTPKDK